MSKSTGTLIAQGLLLALDLYRNHNGLAADWVPTEDDWNQLESEVEVMTAQSFKDEARAALPVAVPVAEAAPEVAPEPPTPTEPTASTPPPT